ncbi:hypothetical protein DFH09DRAFT_1288977 [Mycena vulgaris]|nr:hypothetical protein DFH09DRAFT_1288977 [Mycena vulgaris]
MEASRAAQLAWDREEHRSATAWLNNPTYAATLRHLHAVPPLKPTTGGMQTKTISEKEKHLPALEKVTSCPDWLDTIVTGQRPSFARTVPEDHAFPIHRCMIAHSRRKPYRDSEVNEKMTDDFHLHTILDPAAAIAAAMRDEPICAGLAQGQNSTFSDLTVHTVVEDRRTHWVAAEDKRSQIFTTHEVEFRDYANHEKFPWPSRKQMDQAPSGMRIWIQLWGQMCEYNVDYAKLFSPAGVIYVRRSAPGSTLLIFSKTYANLDADVERSACVIWLITWTPPPQPPRIPRYRKPRGVHTTPHRHDFFFLDVSDEFDFSSLITPVAFTNVLGQGASGTVVSSANRSDVVKVFSDESLARHEVNALTRARGLAVPVARGFVSAGDETGVVMTYEGSPIRDLGRATTEQKRQLAAVLRSLHGRGIHHHDVRENNVLNGRACIHSPNFVPNILAAFIHIFLPYSNKIGHLPAIYILSKFRISPSSIGPSPSSSTKHGRWHFVCDDALLATARHTKKLATSRIFLIGYGLGQTLCTQFWKAQYAPKFIVPWTICLESYAADIAIVTTLWLVLRAENARRDALAAEKGGEGAADDFEYLRTVDVSGREVKVKVEKGFLDLTDRVLVVE